MSHNLLDFCLTGSVAVGMIDQHEDREYDFTTTQRGTVAEHVVAIELMMGSEGRLAPFKPIADDDGLDLLVYDKVTG
jgi:hypothetical protein